MFDTSETEENAYEETVERRLHQIPIIRQHRKQQ